MSHSSHSIVSSPVCIAELPGYQYQVSADTITESVVGEFEKNPDIPGVLVLKNNKLDFVMTRLKLFEHLGHRFGVELFLRKPVETLQNLFHANIFLLDSHLQVGDAVQYALNRPIDYIYDPIVIETAPGNYRLLEMTTLLIAQMQINANVNNVVGKMDQIDRLIYAEDNGNETLSEILELLQQVVPYHNASIILQNDKEFDLLASSGPVPIKADLFSNLCDSQIYKLMVTYRQPIYISDTTLVPAWQNLSAFGSPRSWIGVPLLSEQRSLGFLSIGRSTPTPFTINEKESAQVFAQRIVISLLMKQKRETATFIDSGNALSKQHSLFNEPLRFAGSIS